MVGSSLTRFSNRRFLIWDVESEGLSLSHHRPWELSYAVATIGGGIERSRTWFIHFPDLSVSPVAAQLTRFDPIHYAAHARPAAEVWDDFAPFLYSPEYYSVGHNLLGLDVYMISTLRRALGLPPDHSWIDRVYDTHCLSKALLKGWMPPSPPAPLLPFQYQCLDYVERGLKTRLGLMCAHFGLPYDPSQAHSAGYDVDRNWAVFRELVFKMEI